MVLKQYTNFQVTKKPPCMHYERTRETPTFCSGAELMVNGCHSLRAIVGIFTKTQSPGENVKLSGLFTIKFVTFDGSILPT